MSSFSFTEVEAHSIVCLTPVKKEKTAKKQWDLQCGELCKKSVKQGT